MKEDPTANLMAMLLDNVSDAVISFDNEKNIIYWNKGAEKIYGWTSQEAIGQNAARLLRTEADEALRNERLNNAEILGELVVEAVHYTKDNLRIIIESRVFPIKDNLGEISGYTVINKDITRQRKSEETLQEIENRYTSLFNNKTIAISHCRTITDERGFPADYEIIKVNDAYTKVTGIKKEDIEGKTAREVFPGIENFSFDYICNFGKVALEGGELNFEVFFETLNQWLSIYVYRPRYGEFTAIFTDITQRKKDEADLKESEQRLKNTLDNMLEGCAIIDFDWNYLYVNEVNAVHAHCKREDMIGKNMFELVPGVEKSVFFEAYKKCMEERTPQYIEAGFTFENGSKAWYESKANPVPEGIFVVSADITLRKKAEEDYKTLAEHSPEVIARFDKNLRHTYINEYGAKVYGVPKEEIIGKTAAELGMPLDKVEFWKKHFLEVFKTGIQQTVEFDFESPNFGHQYLSSLFVPEPGLNDEVVSILAITRDITQRNLQEKKLEEAFHKLQESESWLNDAQKLAHIGSFVYDYKTGQVKWSEEIFNIYEIDTKCGVPPFEAITAMWHPEDLAWITEEIANGMLNKTVIKFECRILLPSSKVKYINYIARGIYDSEGKPLKRVGAAADITERKLQELELLKTLEDLKRSNYELEQFAYVASHDLQEPIRMISTYTRMLELQLKDSLDEKSKQYMFFVTDGSKRMHHLIQDLLAYSRVTSKTEPFTPTDLNGVLAEVLRDLQLAVTDHDAEIISCKLPVLKTYPAQIKLVFQNLIQNAIKFRGEERPVIEIGSRKKGREWIFFVKDNGIGIAQDCYEKIFEVFQRLHEKEKYPGTGIGLSICKKIVERHGGRIWVESELDKGSAFYFTLSDRS